MKDGRIMLLSCEGRQHLIDFWLASLEAFWSTCPLQVDVLDESTVGCWSARLLAYLERVSSPWVLLWVDDNVLSRKADTRRIQQGFELFLSRSDIATVHISGMTRAPGMEPIPGLPPYAYVSDMSLAMVPHPAFWRRGALLIATRDVVGRVSPAQDDGWAGFYNWELHGGAVLQEQGWRGIGLHGDCSEVPIPHCNAFRQGLGWSGCAVQIAEQIGYTLDPKYGFYPDDEQPTPCSDAWREAGRPRLRGSDVL